jgi:hypothetical protein
VVEKEYKNVNISLSVSVCVVRLASSLTHRQLDEVRLLSIFASASCRGAHHNSKCVVGRPDRGSLHAQSLILKQFGRLQIKEWKPCTVTPTIRAG